jgi:hypothetical protein
MISENKEFICDYGENCGKLATRVLRYHTRSSAGELEYHSEMFCDEHAETEMRKIQRSGVCVPDPGPRRRKGIEPKITNCSLEDDCWHEFAKDRKMVVRVGKNVDPTWYGYVPERRGTTFVLDWGTIMADSHVLEKGAGKKKM